MKEWTTACPDWAKRIVAGRSLITSPPLFPDEAEAALNVFKSLRMVDVPGQPTFGEACDQWVFDLVAAIFGAYDSSTGKRLISEFFLCVAKKNGKSTIAAGIMLTALIRNWRQLNDLLILAPTKEAADNSFKPAAAMVRADPDLCSTENGRLHIQDHLKLITDLSTKATLKVLAADGKTVVGKKAGFVLVDELWEFGTVANAEAMLMEATGGLIARPEGFVISITTQSDKPPAGVFKKKLDKARGVRDGKIEDKSFLPVIYEFPQRMIDDGSYQDPDNFYISNPSVGKAVTASWIDGKLKEKLTEDVGSRNIFLAKHLNIEIGQNHRDNRWAGTDFWSRRAVDGLTLESLMEQSEVVVVGIDGGGLDDLFGFAVIGRHKETRDWLVWSHAWCHEGVLERRKSIASQLLDFKRAGELTIVDDELADISAIVEIIDEINRRGLLASVAVDPAGLGEMIEALAEIGVTQEGGQLIGAPQGWAMMNAIKTAERKLANGTMKHSGSKMMAWCVGNLKIEPTATGVRATKQNAGDAKIDPVMALFDAVTVMSRNPETAGPSVYQSRGALVL